MKKLFSVILVISLLLFSTVTVSFAGSKHGYRSYKTHYRTWPSHYRHPAGHHSFHASHFFPYFGVGMLTGALIGSVISTPPRPKTVYYTSPAQIIVQPDPVMVPQYTPLPPPAPPELVLQQVKIIGKIVNIRSGPGLENTVIDQALHNETVDVIGVAPEWLYVKTGEGRYGWLMKQYTLEIGRPVG